MSGSDSQIPLQGRPIDIAGEQLKWMKPQTEFLGQQQTQARTGLIGQETTAAGIGNELARANADISLPILGQIKQQVTSPGMIGAEHAGQGTGIDLSVYGVGTVPVGVAQGILQSADKVKAAENTLALKKTNVARAANGTMDQNGNVNPILWQRMLDDQLRSGWMSPAEYRQLSGHPEYGKTLANSMVPTEQQPYFKKQVVSQEEAARAPYKEVATGYIDANGNWVPTKIPMSKAPGFGEDAGATPAPNPTLPRGLRNNNPLNLEFVPGQGANASDGRFGVYPTMEAGVAANVRQLQSYQNDRGLNTISAIVNRWAPPGENDSSGYAIQVAKLMGVKPNAPLNLSDPQQATRLVMAMGQVENGQMLDHGAVQRGVQMAFTPGALPSGASGAAPAPRPPQVGVQTGPSEFTPQVKAAAERDAKQIDADSETNTANVQAGLNATRSGVTLRQFRDNAAGAPTGSFADQRLALQAAAQESGSPFIQQLSSYLTGIKGEPGVTQMEVIKKLALNNVVSQEQGIPGARIGAMMTTFFAKASPNINMRPGSVADMVNMGVVMNQLAADFGAASNDHYIPARDAHLAALKENRYEQYQPLNKFEKGWLSPKSIHGPDVYTAAINLLNNTPVQKAFGSLTPEQRNEAVAIIGRAAPGAQAELMARPDIQAWRASLAAPRK